MSLVKHQSGYRHSWMVPRNKRYIDPYNLSRELCVLQKLLLENTWKGNQSNQNKFIKILQDLKIKKKGIPYDPHSGGGRTYINQLWSLGLTFTKDEKHFLTISGELIANGSAPVPILQHNLLSFQYPSPYSRNFNCNINPRILIKPFLFILKFLYDPEINYLNDYEIILITIFGHNPNCYKICKKLIQNFRKKTKIKPVVRSLENFYIEKIQEIIIANKAEDYITTTKTKDNPIDKIIKNLKDNANTFGNYLDASQLVEIRRKDNLKFIVPNYEFAIKVWDQLKKENDFIKINKKDILFQEQFQRQFGKYLNKKDTRSITSIIKSTNKIPQDNIIIIQAFMPYLYDNPSIKFIPRDLIHKLRKTWAFNEKKIENILNPIIKNNWSYYEKDFIESSISGRVNPIGFEKKVCKIFQRFNFNTKHTGQLTRHSGGGYSDVLAVTKNNEICILADAKAIKKYSISSSDKSIMIDSYAKHYKELLTNESIELESIIYICGTYGAEAGIKQKCEDIYRATGKKTSVIDAVNILKLVKFFPGKTKQITVRKIFKSGGVLKI